MKIKTFKHLLALLLLLNLFTCIEKINATVTLDGQENQTYTRQEIKRIVEEVLKERIPLETKLFGVNPIIYNDIFEAYNKKEIVRQGDPPGWNDFSFTNSNQWNGFALIHIGSNTSPFGTGILVNIPKGYSMLWVRILNDRYQAFRAINPSNNMLLGVYGGGNDKYNLIGPDGGLNNGPWHLHNWVPIPVNNLEKVILSTHTLSADGWISGIAFSKNPWSWITSSAFVLAQALNEGTKTTCAQYVWENMGLTCFGNNFVGTIKVPIIPNNNTKLVFINEHNNNWNGGTHRFFVINSVNRKARLLSTYDNPYARHVNSKQQGRFLAFEVYPHEVPENSNFIDITVVLGDIQNAFWFSEVGSIDAFLYST